MKSNDKCNKLNYENLTGVGICRPQNKKIAYSFFMLIYNFLTQQLGLKKELTKKIFADIFSVESHQIENYISKKTPLPLQVNLYEPAKWKAAIASISDIFNCRCESCTYWSDCSVVCSKDKNTIDCQILNGFLDQLPLLQAVFFSQCSAIEYAASLEVSRNNESKSDKKSSNYKYWRLLFLSLSLFKFIDIRFLKTIPRLSETVVLSLKKQIDNEKIDCSISELVLISDVICKFSTLSRKLGKIDLNEVKDPCVLSEGRMDLILDKNAITLELNNFLRCTDSFRDYPLRPIDIDFFQSLALSQNEHRKDELYATILSLLEDSKNLRTINDC